MTRDEFIDAYMARSKLPEDYRTANGFRVPNTKEALKAVAARRPAEPGAIRIRPRQRRRRCRCGTRRADGRSARHAAGAAVVPRRNNRHLRAPLLQRRETERLLRARLLRPEILPAL